MELEAQADAQTVQDIELEQDPVAVQERWNFYKKKAAIYYLANPAGDPWTNDTGAWAPTEETSNTLGTIDIENAKWEDGYVGNTVYKEKNIKEKCVESYYFMAGWKYRYNLDSKEWKYDYWFIFYIYIGFNLGELQKSNQ